jgi:arylsulfatase A
VSFLPALLGRPGAPPRPAVVHHSIHGVFAIREGPWKLIVGAGSGGWAKPGDAEALAAGLPTVQLYHLADDPGETRNLQASRPEIVARLRGQLDGFIARGRSTPGPEQRNDTAISVEKTKVPARK